MVSFGLQHQRHGRQRFISAWTMNIQPAKVAFAVLRLVFFAGAFRVVHSTDGDASDLP